MTRIAQIFINYFFACFAPLREKVFLSKTQRRKTNSVFLLHHLSPLVHYSFFPFFILLNIYSSRLTSFFTLLKKYSIRIAFFIILLNIYSCSSTFAQNNTNDSLNTLLKTATHDTTRLRLLVELSEECEPTDILIYAKPAEELADKLLRNKSVKNFTKIKKLKASVLSNIGFIYNNQGQVKEALDYFGRSLKLQEVIGDKEGIATSLNNIGAIYNNQGQVKEALDYYGRSLKLYEEITSVDGQVGDKQGIAYSLNNIGAIYNNQGQVKEALDYYGRSLKIREEIGDKQGIAISLNNIGIIYNNQGQVKDALDYYGRSLKLQEEIGNKQGIANSLNSIGFIYKNQGWVKEALDYYGRSLKLQEEIGNKQGIATSLNNIGMIYKNQGKMKVAHQRDSLFNRALDYFGRSLKLHEEIGDKQGIAISLNNIGGIYRQQKNYLLALSYSDSSLSLAKELGYPEIMRDAELTLAKIDSARGKPAGAFEHYKLYIIYRDSIKNKENEKAAIRQQTKYEFEKMLLVKEQEERERRRQEVAVVGRRNKLQYSIILIVVVALMSSLLLLGKIKVSHKIAEGIVFFVFLIFFEFLLVLADPYIESVTGGAPGLKLLFNALIGAAIYPVHAFFERWVRGRIGRSHSPEASD